MFIYTVRVKGLIKDGHPHKEMFMDLHTASKTFDTLAEQYPYNEVTMMETSETFVAMRQAKKLPENKRDCPYEHSRSKVNERSAILSGSNGKRFCQICGWKEN